MDYDTYADALQVLKGFGAKADGKDKLTALIQYVCMFLSGGEPGNLKRVQASVTAARKVFRVMRPLESLTPLLLDPKFKGVQPWSQEALAKLKDVLMATYFAADHLVWAHQIGLVNNKKVGERAQKVSLYSWALGSLCSVYLEAQGIIAASVRRLEGESEADWLRRQEAARREINSRLLVLVHGVVQALTAAGLLQLLPFKPRTVGLLGSVASAINCYLLLPAMPQRKPKAPPAALSAPGATVADGKLVAKVA